MNLSPTRQRGSSLARRAHMPPPPWGILGVEPVFLREGLGPAESAGKGLILNEPSVIRLFRALIPVDANIVRLSADSHDVDFAVTIEICRGQVFDCHAAVLDDVPSPFGRDTVLSLVEADTASFLG